jgi:hypothetical protein
LATRLNQEKVIVLRRDWQKGQPVKARNRLNGDTPIGATLRDGGRYRIVRARLIGVADRLGTAEKAVDEHTRAGTGIAGEAATSSASVWRRAVAVRTVFGGTAVMRASISVSIVPSGVRRAMRWPLESTVIAIMIRTFAGFYDCAAK